MSARKNHGSIRPPKESLSDTNSTHNASNLIQSVIKSDTIDQNLSKTSKLKVVPSKKTQFPDETLEKAVTALNCIPNDLEREMWVKVATALKVEFGDSAKNEFLNWSDNGKSADRSNANATWRSINVGCGVTINSLYFLARQHGYTEERQQVSKADYAKQQQAQAERKSEQARRAIEAREQLEAEQQRAQTAINEVIPYLTPATPNSTIYLKNKKSDGRGAYLLDSDDLQKTSIARFTYPFNDLKKGALVIPFQDHLGGYVSAQCIYNGTKRYVKGSISKNSYAYVGLAPLPQTENIIYIGEGYATVNSVLQADGGSFGVMAKDANNLPLVAELMRQRYAKAQIVILADNDKSEVGQKKAKEAGQYANNILIPDWIEGQIKSTDFNDVHVIKGIDALRNVLNTPSAIQEIEPPQSLNYINVNDRYALDGIKMMIDMGETSIRCHADMKSGKTYSVGWLLKNHPKIKTAIYIGHLISINKSTAERLASEFGIDFVSYQDLQHGQTPAGVATTFNSLPMVIEKLGHSNFDLVVVDETEGAAGFMASGTITNKSQAGQALRKLSEDSKIVLLSDAHMDVNTDAFQNAFFPIRDFITVKNDYKHWENVKYQWIDDRDKGIEWLKERLKSCKDKPLFVYFTSSALADETHAICEKIGLFDNIKTLLASGSTSKKDEVIDAKRDNSLFNTYSVVFGSPTLGIGLSIEADKNKPAHFNEAMVFFTRDKRTGDSKSAIQMPFRTRDIRLLTAVEVDQGADDIELNKELGMIRADEKNLQKLEGYLIGRATKDDEAKELLDWLSKSQITYEATIKANNMQDHVDYYENIDREFKNKGMIELPPLQIDVDGDKASKEFKEIRNKIRESNKQEVIRAKDKTVDEITAIEAMMAFRPDSITDEELNSVRKHRLIENYIDTDYFKELNSQEAVEELEEAWGLQEKGIHNGRKNLQSALLPKQSIDRICNTWIAGIGQSKAMQRDIGTHSSAKLYATNALDKIILKYSGIQKKTDGTYSMEADININDKMLKTQEKGKFTTEIRKVMKSFNAVSELKISATLLKEEPARLLANLLKSRFKLTMTKTRYKKTPIIKRQSISKKAMKSPIYPVIAGILGANKEGRIDVKQPIVVNESLIPQNFAKIMEKIAVNYNKTIKKGDKKRKRITKHQVENQPLKLFKNLAKELGITIDMKSKPSNWEVAAEQVVIENINLATDKGLNNLRNFDARIGAELCFSESGDINIETKDRLNITAEIENHIKTCLNHIAPSQHHVVLREYIETASQPVNSEKKLRPLALANLFLLRKAGLKNSIN